MEDASDIPEVIDGSDSSDDDINTVTEEKMECERKVMHVRETERGGDTINLREREV